MEILGGAKRFKKLWTQSTGKALLIFLFACVSICVSGCVTVAPPNDEFSLAKAALDAARAVQSVRYSPGFWHQAEEFCRRARILYKEREYEEARELFTKCRISAEKAENSARLIRQKTGDVL